MISDYTKMKSFLDSHNMTHEDMDNKWTEIGKTNKI